MEKVHLKCTEYLKDYLQMRAKVRNLNNHLNDGILDRVYTKLHRDA